MSSRCFWPGCVLALALLLPPAARAVEPTPAQAEFFTKKIKPVLQQFCFECHSHASGKNKGKLVLDSRAALLKGGGSGPAVVPGKPAESLLLTAISYTDPELKMPPKGKLPQEAIDLLKAWIAQDLPWPGGAQKQDLRPAGQITDEDRRFWSFQPLADVAPPAVAAPSWNQHPIDRFIYQRLKKEGMKPSPPADRLALLRRLTFDLTGLPPTPDEVAAFEKSASRSPQSAIDETIDRLLASPRYAERAAQPWLDVVRYAESDGYRQDAYRPDAWRYRDWVIRAFQNDMPYDEFVRQQLAGDEIAPHDPDVVVATTFLRHTIYEFNQRDVRSQWQSMLDEVTDVTADVFLGMSMGCARCHDHKFDPILQKDYFRLQAFFTPMLPRDDIPLATPAQQAEHQKKLQAWLEKTATLRSQIDELEAPTRAYAINFISTKFPPDIQKMLAKQEVERTPLEKQLAALAHRQVIFEVENLNGHIKDAKVKERLTELRKELAKLEKDKPLLPRAMLTRDVGINPPPTLISRKDKEGIDPGFLTILDPAPAKVTPLPELGSTGRRLALANWLTRPDHPLTTRVIVNRIWQQHFGRGLVATANDLGKLGEKPSHPELLDWLARRFVQDGWSFKKLHKLILTSRAYQQAAIGDHPEAAMVKDPENRLLWRMRTRRLDAEQIRDAILSVNGKLDPKPGGPSVEPTEPRRTVYTKVRRNARDQMMEAFDAPDGFSSTAQRNVTTSPTQALLMINSPFMQAQSKAFAERLQKETNGNLEKTVERAFRLAFGRAPTQAELDGTRSFLADQAERIGGDPSAARRAALVDLCQVLLNANEFLYVD